MLSRQYNPRGGDYADEDGPVKPIRRNRSSVYANNAAPQLTIKDLQKLDDLADAAAAGNGSEANLIRSQLRRSISLGFMSSSQSFVIHNIIESKQLTFLTIFLPFLQRQSSIRLTALRRKRKKTPRSSSPLRLFNGLHGRASESPA
jgi:hypothetical protein